MSTRKILITCEHADKIIPSAYSYLFVNGENDLSSHKGYDPGALDISKYLARELHVGLYYQKVSRLLIEMNRSLNAGDLFSKYTYGIPKPDQEELKNKYYFPYRNEVELKISDFINNGEPVLHLSIHTFTPSLNGIERLVDIGILCDEQKQLELELSNQLVDKLSSMLPDMLIMINMPYNGADDGFTTYLRTKFDQKDYLGLELEINQKYINSEYWPILKKALLHSLN